MKREKIRGRKRETKEEGGNKRDGQTQQGRQSVKPRERERESVCGGVGGVGLAMGWGRRDVILHGCHCICMPFLSRERARTRERGGEVRWSGQKGGGSAMV